MLNNWWQANAFLYDTAVSKSEFLLKPVSAEDNKDSLIVLNRPTEGLIPTVPGELNMPHAARLRFPEIIELYDGAIVQVENGLPESVCEPTKEYFASLNYSKRALEKKQAFYVEEFITLHSILYRISEDELENLFLKSYISTQKKYNNIAELSGEVLGKIFFTTKDGGRKSVTGLEIYLFGAKGIYKEQVPHLKFFGFSYAGALQCLCVVSENDKEVYLVNQYFDREDEIHKKLETGNATIYWLLKYAARAEKRFNLGYTALEYKEKYWKTHLEYAPGLRFRTTS